ncbi:PREDICTED: fructose-1 [Prunus dulcis]|uniref:PREDICTED: fructose-1 n=1 Tax=Prunus dulcis TaxID=3755 RepID=A0A5E4EZA7_PRUDU|nr:PREDICTED: fructose-1 [Prunus dulcis]
MDHAADAQRTDLMTIARYALNEQSKHPEACGDFTILLNHIVLGCKFVCSAVSKAGLAKVIGLAGETNVQALDLVPKKIHERYPVFLGSYADIEEIKQLYGAT